MSDDNLPDSSGPVDDAKTFDQSVEDITNLLPDDPATDPVRGGADQAKADAADDGDDPEIDLSEDVEDSESDENEDGSEEPEIKGGRFAPDTAKVTLEDGTVITVADLKRNNLFQRDYTKKTTELSAEREQITRKASEVDQQAQSLAQLAERLQVFSHTYLPTPPEPFTGTPDTDPIGYMRHMQATEKYNQAYGQYMAIDQERTRLLEAQQQQAHAQTAQAIEAEFATLRSKDAFFSDANKVKGFLDEATTKGAEWWGLTPERIGRMQTAEEFLILRDALRYRRAVAKAPEVAKQVGKPAMARVGKRAEPGARVSSQQRARSEQLRSTGSIDSFVAAVSDLID